MAFGAAKRAHHRAQEEMRRQNEINNFNSSQARAQQALQDQMRQAREREARFERQNQVLMAQLQEMTIQNKQAIADQQAFYDGQLAATREASEAQISSLNDLMVQQRTGFETQLAASQAAYDEQKRIATNLGNAYVPEAQQSALAPAMADTAPAAAVRKAKDNELSQLAIVNRPMAGNAAMPLAGLQIA